MNSNENQSSTVTMSGSINEQVTSISTTELQTTPMHEKEEKNSTNDDTPVQTSPNTVEDKLYVEEQKEKTSKPTTTVNQNDDERRTKKNAHSRVKYSMGHPHRSSYYSSGSHYAGFPYYYYPPMVPFHEKPPPLMFIPTPITTATDTSNTSTAISSTQNLPPRLRQGSATENEPTTQSTTSPQANTTNQNQNSTTNQRRHRNLLGKTNYHYCPQHLPPPLMATPPGVVFTYPPGHIAYNIRSADDADFYPYQQPFTNVPTNGPPLVWSTISPYHPAYPAYSAYGASTYPYTMMTTVDSNGSLLNPNAAEWRPSTTYTDDSTAETNILIDDEINFPPLQNAKPDESSNEQDIQPPPTKDVEATHISSANVSSVEENKSSTIPKSMPISYSTVISQTADTNKASKIETNTTTSQIRKQISSVANSTTQNVQTNTKERTGKMRQRNSQTSTKETTNGRRNGLSATSRSQQASSKDANSIDTTKLQTTTTTVISDDWIEVKSKKTKKYDRPMNGTFVEDIPMEEKTVISTEEIHSPVSSVESTVDNTTISSNSEDDEDSLNRNDSGVGMTVDNNQNKQNFNRTVIDDIHHRLGRKERLLIILRGCPGSGKSTLARDLNAGYNGQIFSPEEYFDDEGRAINSSESELTQRTTQQAVFEALKKKITPIIIDNTNAISAQMKPYVVMGQKASYEILLIEPQTPWRHKARTLFKRQLGNLSMKQIREILNRFEQNLTIESILLKSINHISLPESLIETVSLTNECPTYEETIDPVSTGRKYLPVVDDAEILNDVRLCIDDMIIFITSSFYQTRQSSSPLSLSFSDFSIFGASSSSNATTTNSATALNSSLPTTPSSPHALLHRSFSRFSTTNNQDLTFASDHRLRVPAPTFSRCIDNRTASTTTKPTATGKKRQKNKAKLESSNENLFNTNNNNNNSHLDQTTAFSNISKSGSESLMRQTFQVILPEDLTEYFFVDDQTVELKSVSDQFPTPDFNGNAPSQKPAVQPTKTIESTNTLLSVLQDEFKITSRPTKTTPIIGTDVAIQCTTTSINQTKSSDDRILTCKTPNKSDTVSYELATRTPGWGYRDSATQVDFEEQTISSLSELLEIYLDRISEETIRYFYHVCKEDVSWTRRYLDEYVRHDRVSSNIPTLRQLSFDALKRWNEMLSSSNPSFQNESFTDLLRDINDDEQFHEASHFTSTQAADTTFEITENRQIFIPVTLIQSLQECYGDIPNISYLMEGSDGVFLPLDDSLNLAIYTALGRFVGIERYDEGFCEPVTEKNKRRTEKKPHSSKWKAFEETNRPKPKSNAEHSPIPSFATIMDEDLRASQAEKSKPRSPLDLASQEKMRNLQKVFPNLNRELIEDIFADCENDYDLTRVTIASMLDDKAQIPTIVESPVTKQPVTSVLKQTTGQIDIKTSTESFLNYRNLAAEYMNKRKEFYDRANKANRHHMMGVVSYYINQAHEYGLKAKEANRAAYEELAETRLQLFRKSHRLDLHDFHEEEALNLFKRVENELHCGIYRTTELSIDVVTGYGKGSVYGGGYGKIRQRIIHYLKQKNYKYIEVNRGALRVHFFDALH